MSGDEPVVRVDFNYEEGPKLGEPLRIQLHFGNGIGKLSAPSGVDRSAYLAFKIRQIRKFDKISKVAASLNFLDKEYVEAGASKFQLPIDSEWTSSLVRIDPKVFARVRNGGICQIQLLRNQLIKAKIDLLSSFEIKDVQFFTNRVSFPPGAERIWGRNLVDSIVRSKPTASKGSAIIDGETEGVGGGLLVELEKGGQVTADDLVAEIPATPIDGKDYGVAYLLVEQSERDPDLEDRLEKTVDRGELITFLFEGAGGLRISAMRGSPISIRGVGNKVQMASVDYPQSVAGKKTTATIRRHLLPVKIPVGFKLKSITIAAGNDVGALAHLHHISFHTNAEAAAMKLNDPAVFGQWTAVDGLPPGD